LDDPAVLTTLSDSLTSSAKEAEAEESARRSIRLAPDHARAWNALGNVLFGRRAYPEALEA
jgi:Flp pilus assembly protein TadD